MVDQLTIFLSESTSATDNGWVDHLTNHLGYPQSQVLKEPIPSAVGVYRDATLSQCLALISASAADCLSEMVALARRQGAEFLVVGSPTHYTTYQIGPYGLVPSLLATFPSWMPRLRQHGLVSKRHTLPPFRDEDHVRRAFAACHDAIYFSSAKDPAAAFDLLSLVVAAKVRDELSDNPTYEFCEIDERHDSTVDRVNRLLRETRQWLLGRDLDDADVPPVSTLPYSAVRPILHQLQDFSLTLTSSSPLGTDLLGVAYERLVGATFRGELGSYFTPRNIADFMVRFLKIHQGKVFDPSCGSAGFLVAALRYATQRGDDHSALDLFGNDLNPRMVEAAKVNFLIHGKNPDQVIHGDGLELGRMLKRWFEVDIPAMGEPLWDTVEGPFDFVLANPPFAGHEKRHDLLRQFSTAHRPSGSLRSLNKTIPFLELIVASLREGGRAGVVIPTSILNAEEASFVRFRDMLLTHSELIAIIGLPEKAFVHTDCGVHGALLFFERNSQPRDDYNVFIGWAEQLGYDRLGKPTRNSDFPRLLERFSSKDWNEFEHVSIRDLVAYQRWDPTWLRFTRTNKPDAVENDTTPLTTLVEVRPAKWSRRQIDLDKMYRYFEVADTDIATGDVLKVHETTGFELLKKGRIRLQVRDGDILLPNHRDSLMAAATANGRSVVHVSSELDGVLTTDRFIVLRPRIDPTLLISLLNSRGIRRQLVAQCRGAASLDIRESMFANVQVPKSLLEPKHATRVNRLVQEIEHLRGGLNHLTAELDRAIEPEFGQEGPIRPPAAG